MRKKVYWIRLTLASIVFILAILAFLGVYPLKFINLQFLASSQRMLIDLSIGAGIFFGAIVLLTLLFGRFYCSLICPFGILQEFAALIYTKIYSKFLNKKNIPTLPSMKYKYIVLALGFGALLGGSCIIIRHIDPYSLFGSFVSLSAYGLIITLAILALVFFKNRFFCANICPIGSLLGLISKISLFKNYMKDICVKCGSCARNCPTGCIQKNEVGAYEVENETCVKCLKCVSICSKSAMTYGIKPKQEVKFDFSKRRAIWAVGVVGAFSAAFGAGYMMSKKVASKIKSLILPAGAKNANRMANTCLNCNLCVQNCPQRILAKADKRFGAVHIDYTKGEHYCNFDCHKCSEVCPSGAIAKNTLEEKQKTRIAMASVGSTCIGCSRCVYECPKHAIEFVDYQAKIDGSKCIGCGKCAASCPMGAISLFGIKEQSVI